MALTSNHLPKLDWLDSGHVKESIVVCALINLIVKWRFMVCAKTHSSPKASSLYPSHDWFLPYQYYHLKAGLNLCIIRLNVQ